ncbi:unnamed protein product [Heligmosomoides polygyrus]|uniref:Transposase n=1 Tax=Heligmosomoides polygyrus TaxID=6339 RepID=A0A3P7Z304_HELPZ|nr:unnamed protein product [Heligmosomoides polygyrus]
MVIGVPKIGEHVFVSGAPLWTKSASGQSANVDPNDKAMLVVWRRRDSVYPLSAQLGDLDDAEGPAWDDDIDSTLNQHRAEKHRTRMEEHDRRLREKRGQRQATTGYL